MFQVSEAREGVVVTEMLASGNYILPLRNGELVPSKPPLFHWLGVLVARAFGTYNEFELRFPSAVAALGCVLCLAALTLHVSTPILAMAAAFILLTTYSFPHLAGDGRVDMVLCFFVTAAITAWLRWKNTQSLYFVAACAGCAVLTKGPLGAALPLLVIASIVIAENGIWGLKKLIHPAWALTLLIPAPWFFLAARQAGDSFVDRQLIFENVTRFVGGEGIAKKYWWFYLEHIWLDWAPWSFVALGAVAFLLYQRKQFGRVVSFLPTDPAARALCKECLIWIIVPLILFTLSVGKRRAYLVPLIPPFAIVLSLCAAHWIDSLRRQRVTISTRRLIGKMIVLEFIFALLVPAGLAIKGYRYTYRDFAKNVQSLTDGSEQIHFVKTLREESFDGFFFYYRRHVITHDPQTPITTPGLYLARAGWLKNQNVTGEELARGGRAADNEDQKLVLLRVSL